MVKKVTLLSLLCAIAILCSYIEMFIPSPIGLAGVKLGLANSVIVFSIYFLSFKEAYLISIVRVLITSVLFSGLFSFGFSFVGTTFSIIAMYLVNKTNIFSIVGISVVGAIAHNIGQLTVAYFLLENFMIAYYFAILLLSGIITGICIGVLAQILLKRLPIKANNL